MYTRKFIFCVVTRKQAGTRIDSLSRLPAMTIDGNRMAVGNVHNDKVRRSSNILFEITEHDKVQRSKAVRFSSIWSSAVIYNG